MYSILKSSVTFTDNVSISKPEASVWAIVLPSIIGSVIVITIIWVCIARSSSSNRSEYSDGRCSGTAPRLAHYNPGTTYTDWGMNQSRENDNIANIGISLNRHDASHPDHCNGGHNVHHHGIHASSHLGELSDHEFGAPPAYNSVVGGGGCTTAANSTV